MLQWTGNDGTNDRSCGIGDKGARKLSEALKTNSTLTSLSLYGD